MITLNVAEIAEMLEVSEESVRRWIRENKLAAEKKLGRTGHTIYLQDLVNFVNKSPDTYQKKLKVWLDREQIPYTEVAGRTGFAAAAAGAALGRVVGPVGMAVGSVAGLMLGSTSAKIQLKDIVDEDVSQAEGDRELLALDGPGETDGISEVSAEQVLGEEQVVPQTMPEDKASDPVVERRKELEDKIMHKKLEILTLQKQFRELQTKIENAKDDIKCYELELDMLPDAK